MHLLKTVFGEALNADSITRLFVLEAKDRRLEGVTVEKLAASHGSSVIAEMLSGAQIEVALFAIDADTTELRTTSAAQAQALVDALSETLTASSRGLVEVGYYMASTLRARV